MSEQPNRYVDRFRCSTHIYYEGYKPCPECSNEQTEIDRLAAELAEAREQLEKYEGCVEVNTKMGRYCIGSCSVQIDLPEEFSSQHVTVWVKRRTE